MKAKLIKTKTGFYLWRNPLDKSQEILGATVPIMSDNGVDLREYKLSLKNCQAIERGYDLDELAEKYIGYSKDNFDLMDDKEFNSFKAGFQKALELMGDKKFTEEDMKKAYFQGDCDAMYEGSYTDKENKYIQSLQQTEWDVEIEMELCFYDNSLGGFSTSYTEGKPVERPKLDADNCLILKRV